MMFDKKEAKIVTRPGLIPLSDGKNFSLDGDLKVWLYNKLIVVPKGFVTDLASIPNLGLVGGVIMVVAHFLCRLSNWFEILFVIGFLIVCAGVYLKAYGKYTYAAVVHDYIFQTHMFSFTVCNWYLLRLMILEHTARWERVLIWFNVQAFGYFIYKNDKRQNKNKC